MSNPAQRIEELFDTFFPEFEPLDIHERKDLFEMILEQVHNSCLAIQTRYDIDIDGNDECCESESILPADRDEDSEFKEDSDLDCEECEQSFSQEIEEPKVRVPPPFPEECKPRFRTKSSVDFPKFSDFPGYSPSVQDLPRCHKCKRIPVSRAGHTLCYECYLTC